MGACSSKSNMNVDELRICELERYNVDQAAKIIKLYREIEFSTQVRFFGPVANALAIEGEIVRANVC